MLVTVSFCKRVAPLSARSSVSTPELRQPLRLLPLYSKTPVPHQFPTEVSRFLQSCKRCNCYGGSTEPPAQAFLVSRGEPDPVSVLSSGSSLSFQVPRKDAGTDLRWRRKDVYLEVDALPADLVHRVRRIHLIQGECPQPPKYCLPQCPSSVSCTKID